MSIADFRDFQSTRWTTGEITISRKTLTVSALLALIVFAFFAINIRWIWLYRHGQPLDIDEALYLTFAVTDYQGFIKGGLTGWFSAIMTPNSTAPLVPALTSLLFIVFGPHVSLGLVATVVCGTLLVVATFLLAKEVGSNWVALGSACLVSCAPTVVMFSREFEFAIAAALVATLTLFCLLKSERMKRISWALAFGLFLGLLPLARTMTIAFLPGLVLGAIIYVLVDPSFRKTRLINLALAFAFAIVVASIWLVPNGQYVLSYLLSFGYGARAMEYGPAVSLFSPSSWLLTSREFLTFYGRLPHSVFILVGVFAAATTIISTIFRKGARDTLRQILASPALPILLFLLSGYAALTSSSNRGWGFMIPLIPAVVILAVWSLGKFNGPAFRFLATAAVVAVTCITTYYQSDPRSAQSWAIYLPGIGPVIVADPIGAIQRYEMMYGIRSEYRTASQPLMPEAGRDWVKLSADFAEMQKRKRSPGMILGMRHVLFNSNTIGLFETLNNERRSPLFYIDPIVTEPTVSAYVHWLTTEPVLGGCLLVTTN